MEEDVTAEPELSGDAPAVDRATAGKASGSASVPKKARAPLLLQPAVGHAGAPEELDDSWADNLPEVRPLSLDAKRAKLGRCSEDKAGVSQSSNPPTASAASGVVLDSPLAACDFPASGLVDAWYSDGGGFAGTFAFPKFPEKDGRTFWQDTKEPSRFCIREAATGKWWTVCNLEGVGQSKPNVAQLVVKESKLSPSA